jgi:hypothetical protein
VFFEQGFHVADKVVHLHCADAFGHDIGDAHCGPPHLGTVCRNVSDQPPLVFFPKDVAREYPVPPSGFLAAKAWTGQEFSVVRICKVSCLAAGMKRFGPVCPHEAMPDTRTDQEFRTFASKAKSCLKTRTIFFLKNGRSKNGVLQEQVLPKRWDASGENLEKTGGWNEKLGSGVFRGHSSAHDRVGFVLRPDG